MTELAYKKSFQIAQKANIMINDIDGAILVLIDNWPNETGSDDDLAFKAVVDRLEKKKEQLRNGDL